MTTLFSRLLVAITVSLLTACGGSGGGGPLDPNSPPPVQPPHVEPPPSVDLRPSLLYVAGSGTGLLTAFSVDATTGTLTQVGEPAAAGGNPTQIVVDRDRTAAYVAAFEDGNVRSFSLDPDSGAPTFRSETPVNPGVRVGSVAVHPSGGFVYATDETNNRIAMFTVDSGAFEANGHVASRAIPRAIITHPNGRFAYVANSTSSTIEVYQINQTGVLSEITGNLVSLPASAAQPFVLQIDPAGRFLYVGSVAAGAESVSAFEVDPDTGALTHRGTLRPGGQNPGSIAVDPTGKFVYAVFGVGDTVAAFTVQNGVLELVGSYPTGPNPKAVAVDVTGRYAYVANESDHTISIYSIGPTGALEVVGQPFALPPNYFPGALAIVEKNR